MSTNETTEHRLDTILSAIENPLRDELFNSFHIVNPLEYAKLLHSLELTDSVKASLLALKVGMPQPYKGVDLEPLIARAMEQMWARLGERADV
jgi:hypothetical protein